MNVKIVSSNVGKALLVSALFMFVSVIVSILNGTDSAFVPLTISFIITFLVGFFPFIFVRKTHDVSIEDGFYIIVLSWLLSFVFGMLPYVLWGGEFNLINSWFESVSGYTTTGATILPDVESLPKSLLFWRSSTHFIGGLGVVVFLLLVLPSASPYRLRLTNIELSSLSREGYRYKSSKTVWVIAGIYCLITVSSFLCFWFAGMNPFDAVNHAFSVVSTGGFSTRNESIMHFDSVWVNLTAIFFMILSAMHFGVIYAVFATRSLKPLNNTIVKFYLSSIVLFSLVTVLSLKFSGTIGTWGEAAMSGTFTVVSYLSTTGFAQCDNVDWPPLAVAAILVAAIQCGCTGSTTGGVKVDRVCIVMRSLRSEIHKRIHPSSVAPVKLDNHLLQNSAVSGAFVYIVLYFMFLLASYMLLLIFGVASTEALTGTIACLGNVGPGLGEISSLGNFASQPLFAKLVFSIDMILGRLEIFPVLVLISMLFKREC